MAVNPIGAVEGSPEIIVEIKGSGPKGDTGVSISDISRTSGTGEPGTTDTYTITLTNGATHDFTVYNGANGEVPIATVSRYNGTSKTYFTATVDGITEYKPGLMLMCVPGLNQESSDNVKLNVNGLGYKDIYGITLQGDGSMIYQTVKPFIPQMATLLIYRNSFWVAIDHISLKSDEVPTKNSINLVQSGGVFAALAEKITAPSTASVGQAIVVKTVDDEGKPTEWETVDLPSGGTVDVDATLTEEGKAADAKAVGDAISSLSEDIAGLSVGGISATARGLLINILQNGVFTSDQSANITTLEAALGGNSGGETEDTTYTITNTLTNVTSDNSSTSIVEGSAYTAALTAADGYSIDIVTVTMGGVDITSTAYADGVVSIAAVTGDVVITAAGIAESTETVIDMGEFASIGLSRYTTWYTDGGDTAYTGEMSTRASIAGMTSQKVFDKDTTVSITIDGVGNQIYDLWTISSGDVPMAVDAESVQRYTEQYGTGAWSINISHSITYTVRAGYYLTIFNYTSAGSNATITVTEVA